MIRPDRFDQVAESTLAHYEMFLNTLRGQYSMLTEELGKMPPSKIVEALIARGEANTRAIFIFLDQVYSQMVIDIMGEVRTRGMGPSEQDLEEIHFYLEKQKEETTRLISVSLYRDIYAAAADMRRLALQFSMMVDSARMSPITARLRLVPGRATSLRFSYVDTANRRWRSADYARGISRAFVYQSYIEAVVFAYAKRGLDLLRVVYPDPNHRGHGDVFSVAGSVTHPSYLEAQNRYFHPFSSADLEP